jgi:hypothetical protein
VREIRTLRARWRELETGLRRLLGGPEGETLDTDKEAPQDYRASPRTCRDFQTRSSAQITVYLYSSLVFLV